MDKQTRTSASFAWGMVLIFLPVVIGGLYAVGILPAIPAVQISSVLVIIGCVGLGTYLAFWGKNPRRRRGDWLPSDTLPRGEGQ